MSSHEMVKTIQKKLQEHHKLWENAIPLIASENITSPAVKEACLSDFSHRYAEGWVGERVYAGCKYIDEVEQICLDLMKEIFKVPFADVRPISGVVANLAIYTSFAEANDKMMAISIPTGGHISMGPLLSSSGGFIGGTAGQVSRLDVKYIPFDRYGLNIDVEKAKEAIKEIKPKILMFGASVFPYPQPVKELAPIAHDLGAHVNYDAAHVAGLIAGGQFQDPIREGADTLSCSAHKTLFGPQKGAVIAAREELGDRIKQACFPGLTSNHHLHTVAGLAVALVEFKEFGKAYAEQVIKNAKALAQALYDLGFKVVTPEKGFTQSHVVLVDITDYKDTVGLGGDIEKLLERGNIIINRNLLPWDILEGRHYQNPGGIRLGTSEVTRLGMKESEMKRIAQFMKDMVIDRKEPEALHEEIKEFRKDFQEVKYCFPSKTKAYEYISIP
ncbi:MAG: serine hydroxymethyltransferase [Promethearchaeota archaeon]